VERPEIDKPDGDIPFELAIDDVVEGTGEEAVAGKTVTVHYVGVAFRTGEEFDASWNRGEPFRFKLGKGQVIPGWDAGVQGMKVGGRRKLTIPSAMAYGARGAGGVIQPHEPLIFVVDLLGVD
jgi:peptidylprolyl isomerase